MNKSKPLHQLSNGESLIERQLRLITNSQDLLGIEVTLVTGFQSELYMEYFPHLAQVYNADFRNTNTAKSLLLGIEQIHNESLLWFNGDLFYDESVIHEVASLVEGSRNITFARAENVDQESMKIETRNFSINKKVRKISKDLSVKAFLHSRLEAIGINFITATDIERFKQYLSDVPSAAYFEEAINAGIVDGFFDFYAFPLTSYITEIDFQEDLANVERYLAKETTSGEDCE
jgi:choline kinase